MFASKQARCVTGMATGFFEIDLWVQVHGLPPNQMNQHDAKMAGTLFAGLEVDFTPDNFLCWNRYKGLRSGV